MVAPHEREVKLETNRTLAWFQCHPRASLYLFAIGLTNIILNLVQIIVAS